MMNEVESREGKIKCRVCGTPIPIGQMPTHVNRDHNMKYCDYVKKYGRVSIPWTGAYAELPE